MNEYNIPNGPNDKPFLFLDPAMNGVIMYDVDDRNGELYMLDHELEGCITLPVSKDIVPGCGNITIDGEKAEWVVRKVTFTPQLQVNMLGIRLRGMMTEYGQEAELAINGLTDRDGNVMDPVTLKVRTPEKQMPLPEYADHESVALQAAEEGIVLMKNEGNILPLTPGGVINVFGKGIYDFRNCAVGAGKINPRYSIDFRQAIRERQDVDINPELETFYRCDRDLVPDKDVLKRAREQSDTALFILTRASGENMDNSTAPGEFYLSENEEHLLRTLREIFEHVVVILNVGYPISMRFVDKYQIDAVIYCGFGGMLAGRALANILFGETYPSGRLPDTWVYDYKDLPSADEFYDCKGSLPRYPADNGPWIDTVYSEDIYVGYRYFRTFDVKEAYPFGYGLGYTTFEQKCIACSYSSDDGLCVSVQVKNTGKCAGKETVQIYVQKPDGNLEQPARELIAFEKTRELEPGEEQLVVLRAKKTYLSSYDEVKASYVLTAGEYHIYLGVNAAQTELIGKFEVRNEEVIRKAAHRMAPVAEIDILSQRKDKKRKDAVHSDVYPNRNGMEPKRICQRYPYHFESVAVQDGKKLSFKDVLEKPSLLDQYVSGLEISDLARLAVCAGSGWGMEGTGEAGRLFPLKDQELPRFVVADGNSGVNLQKKNIGMPSGVTICASFNKELAGEIGKVIGEEARELGVDLILAPAFNIHRNPLCGRQPEYFSEDPLLSGIMAATYAKGLEETGVGACYKHLMANNAEVSRKRNQSILTERALREIYFRTFEIALEEYQPVSIMTSYNGVNGRFTSEDGDLIQGLLREEAGFEGFVMTDWCSYDTADIVEMENAGNTWLTPGDGEDTYPSVLRNAVREGKLDEHRLRENIWYLLRSVLLLQQRKQKYTRKDMENEAEI